jgi:hypothetical protein
MSMVSIAILVLMYPLGKMLWLTVIQDMVSSDTVNPVTPQMNVGASAHPMVASRLKLGPLDYSDLSRGDRSFPDAYPNARIRRRPSKGAIHTAASSPRSLPVAQRARGYSAQCDDPDAARAPLAL